MSQRVVRGVWLGCRPYAQMFELQRSVFELRKQGRVEDLVMCLEHEPVITLGRGAKASDLLVSRENLSERGVDVHEVDRGGEVTLHAPGQLVVYPIVSLSPERQDVRRYVQDLTYTMGQLVAAYGIGSGTVDDLIGLWVDQAQPSVFPGPERAQRLAKIGAVGVRLSRWISMHGFALNLCNDLSLYQLIVPCGITQYGVCSLASLSDQHVEPRALASEAHRLLVERLGRRASAFEDLSSVPTPELLQRLTALATSA